jgi:predicted ribosomally synthesized peptide with SipW-like signal peptide
MKKLLFAIMAIVLCVGLIGGAFAYFTDTQTSSGNTFTAGSTYLLMSNGGTYAHQPDNSLKIGSGTNLSPGGPAIGTFNVGFENGGNISGIVTANVSIDQSIVAGSFPPFTPPGYSGPVGANTFATKLVVATAFTDGSGTVNVAPYWAQQIADGLGSWVTAVNDGYVVADPSSTLNGYLPTIYGLSSITLHFWDGYATKVDLALAPGGIHWVNGTLKLASTADNNYENMGINITIVGTLTSN